MMAIGGTRHRVNGIGGFFFRARDPEGLRRWYEDRLGIPGPPQDYDSPPWVQEEGLTVFAPFELDAEMIGPPDKTWMLNLRVDDLDAIAAQLTADGETVEIDPDTYPTGRFAELRDPEGNGIQLWQPA
jgi:catechol 2,3-dioxygenase-like lactoylglutathione lyase family enzyme